MSAYSELRKAIANEVAQHAGVSLEWGRSPRTGEAIIRRGGSDVRVIISRTPSRHDKASAIGRVRRALRSIGLDVPPATPKPIPSVKRKRAPTQAQRIAALEARVEALEIALRKKSSIAGSSSSASACR